ncbi:lysophospholipid acyltransferase 5 [Cephus cinctus]|uniref:Lysophospholipid acyltransferase 5 n=1 Tax=Cephus cinctus TaxID=211228 RepID=A0AAJ7C8U7_CEPCN|nr:lysophospholipid acyltransferase 5 [Cephus cinctus]
MASAQTSPIGLSKLSEYLDVPEPALRLICSLLLGFPLALVHRYTLYGKNAKYQHIYFIACGLAIGFWNYEWNVVHSAAALCVTYLTLKIFGSTVISVTITFIFNMAYLLIGYYMTSTNDYDIKWTMPQCVLTLRLIGLAFDLMDGQKPEDKQSAMQKLTALKVQPSFLEMAAYTYFPGSFLVGPQFSMRRYLDYVHGVLLKSESESAKLPNCVAVGFGRAAIGLIYLAIFQIGTRYISDQYLLSSEFLKQNFFMRCILLGFWGRFNLYKYISCWLITEGVCIVFGLTYNGKNDKGRVKWNGCANVKLRVFENATTFGHYILSFNINTNNWCAEYIYKRLRFLGSKLYSQVVTLLFLAIWHGFHSGYYFCFFMEFIIMYLEKDITPYLEKNQKIQKFMEYLPARILIWLHLKLYTLVFMGYSLIPFVFLSVEKYTRSYASVYYVGHIIFLTYPLVAPYIKRLLREPRPHTE